MTGYDIETKQISKLVDKGLIPSKSPATAAPKADLIILSLPNWSIVQSVVEGKNGLLKTLQKGQIVIDTSTVPPHETTSMGNKLAEKGIEWMDVPISGAAASDLLTARGEDMLKGNFKPKGALWIALKDLGMALESAQKHGVVLPIAGLYQQLMLSAQYAGWDKSDATVVMKIYEQIAGIKNKNRDKK